MGLLDEAIRDHLELKRRHGADEEELARQEAEAFAPARLPEPEDESFAGFGEGPELDADGEPVAPEHDLPEAPFDRAAEAGLTGERDVPSFEWHGARSDDIEVPSFVLDEPVGEGPPERNAGERAAAPPAGDPQADGLEELEGGEAGVRPELEPEAPDAYEQPAATPTERYGAPTPEPPGTEDTYDPIIDAPTEFFTPGDLEPPPEGGYASVTPDEPPLDSGVEAIGDRPGEAVPEPEPEPQPLTDSGVTWDPGPEPEPEPEPELEREPELELEPAPAPVKPEPREAGAEGAIEEEPAEDAPEGPIEGELGEASPEAPLEEELDEAGPPVTVEHELGEGVPEGSMEHELEQDHAEGGFVLEEEAVEPTRSDPSAPYADDTGVEQLAGAPEAEPVDQPTAYMPVEERPLYEPAPDAEVAPAEPLDFSGADREPAEPQEDDDLSLYTAPAPLSPLEEEISPEEPIPLAEAPADEEPPRLEEEPGDYGEPPSEPEVWEDRPPVEDAAPSLTEEEEESSFPDPGSTRGFFEDTQQHEGVRRQRPERGDPDFED